MKKVLYIIPFVAALLGWSCSEEFLDRKNLYEQSDQTFYRTPLQIAQALAGAYACLPASGRGDLHPTYIANARADYSFGGGDPTDYTMHDLAAFENVRGNNAYLETWQQAYRGILRVNMILSRFDQAEYSDTLQRNQDHGEAYFLRAMFYFRLAQIFEKVPLITEPLPVNKPQAEPAAIYAQIASDLKRAIELMPPTPYSPAASARLGHASKWAAQALMARVFLFYTGYYNSATLPLADGGSVSSEDVKGWLDDCIKNSGHSLIPDFRNLWPYSYSPNPTYPYAVNNNLNWVGEEGANTEVLFAVKYSVLASHDALELQYSNQLVLYSSVRSINTVPWGEGWGGTPVNPQLWNEWPDADPRKRGTILNAFDPEEGEISTLFRWVDAGGNNARGNSMHETGYVQKKYHSTLALNDAGELRSIFSILYNPALTDFQIHNAHDDVIIRFADVLLMAAELGLDAQANLDAVRLRAGLGSVSPTLENIKKERLYELAYEGLRYYDLLRWGDAEEAFAKVKDVPVYNEGVPALYSINFRADRAFLPIPESEIQLSGGVLKQHPGWLE